jgi:subtilisin family serine protease
VKVLDGTGSGAFSWIVSGIVYAATEADADVINMSLSGYFPKSGMHNIWWPAKESAYYVSLFNRAVNFAARQGVTVVSAAGNDATNLNHNQDWVVLPAEAGNGMAVSATGPVGLENFDNPASYTNYGTSVIDVAAPGGDHQLWPESNWWFDMVFSTAPGGWMWAAGTSASAPHVSGVAALLIGQNGGEMHPAQVKAIIEQSADDLGKPGMDDYYGRGRINAYKAVTK